MKKFFQDDDKALLKNPDDKSISNILNEIVAPLEQIDETYPDAFLTYFLKGDNPDFLKHLSQLWEDFVAQVMDYPGKISFYNSHHEFKYDDIHVYLAGLSARNCLYDNFFQVFTNEQIIRFGELLVTITRKDNYEILYADSPDWFHYIVCDALINKIDYNAKPFEKRSAWTCERLLSLLKTANTEEAERKLIGVLFGRTSLCGNDYKLNSTKNLLNLSDLQPFLQDHQQVLEQVICDLSTDEQLYFLTAQSNNDLLALIFPNILVKLALSGNKALLKSAQELLAKNTTNNIQTLLHERFDNGNATQRRHCVTLLDNNEENHTFLSQKLANEKTKTVKKAIEETFEHWGKQTEIKQAYTPPELVDAEVHIIPDSFITKIDEAHHIYSPESDYQHFGKDVMEILNSDEIKQLSRYQGIILSQNNLLRSLPEFSLKHAILMSYYSGEEFSWHDFNKVITDKMKAQVELRQIFKILKSINIDVSYHRISQDYLYGRPCSLSTKEQFVPFFWEHPELIAEALGIVKLENSNSRYYEAKDALTLLTVFPAIPAEYIKKLMDMALTKKTLMKQAQALLAKVPDIYLQLFDNLHHKRADVRQTAVIWLAKIGRNAHKDNIISALNAQLEEEKDNTVASVIIDSLEILGQDISAYLSEENLLQEAESGLKSKIPEEFEWFDLKRLPAMQWQNGQPVNPTIIEWWIVMAYIQNKPEPQRVFQRYLNLLDEKSQETLAKHVFFEFIAEDTQVMSMADAIDTAKIEAPHDLRVYQERYQNYPDTWGAKYKDITLADVEQIIIKEKSTELLGSAIKSKGILTFANKATGGETVKTLQDFMKKHFRRFAQIKALISAFRGTNDPMTIQFLLTVARKSRAQTLSELAHSIVTEIADQNSWTADELADRTIPTAGLDDDGVLRLDYGERIIKAMLNDKNIFIIENDKGKIVKTLPQARQYEDKALIKEAKSQFSNSKKELKQVIEQQTARLYEYMCRERLLSPSDWQTYLFEHPIMKRLISRLVWLAVEADGEVHAFRPSEDGCLLDIDDDEITLKPDCQIKLAHRALLDDAQCEAWQANFKDYEVATLFNQLINACPAFENKADCLDNFKGYLTNTLILRGLMGKQGYARGEVIDGGCFYGYDKVYDSMGINVIIGFSGSNVTDEELPAILHDITFYNNSGKMKLGDVPVILLAETFAEYAQIAKGTTGYAENWEKISPWR